MLGITVWRPLISFPKSCRVVFLSAGKCCLPMGDVDASTARKHLRLSQAGSPTRV